MKGNLNKTKHPTQSELEILQILWKNGPSSVRFVNDQLNLHKPVGYTTSLKLMQIMAEKKLVSRKSEGRKHIYTALLEETKTQNRLLDKFVDATFKGSAMKLVMQVLGKHKASPQELEEIKAYISKIEQEQLNPDNPDNSDSIELDNNQKDQV